MSKTSVIYMKKYLFFFLLLLLVLPGRSAYARTPLGEDERRVAQAVAALNEQIRLNRYYLSIGRPQAANYVVDMWRSILGDKQAFLQNGTVSSLDDFLADHHVKTHVGVYLLISMPYAPKGDQTPAEIEAYQKQYAKQVFEKSDLSDKLHQLGKNAQGGLLISLDGYLATIQRNEQNEGMTIVWKYYLAVGKQVAIHEKLATLNALGKDEVLSKAIQAGNHDDMVTKLVKRVCQVLSGVSPANMVKMNDLLTSLMESRDPKTVATLLAPLDDKAYAGFTLAQRIHLLKALTKLVMDEEKQVQAVKLLKHTPGTDASGVLLALKGANDYIVQFSPDGDARTPDPYYQNSLVTCLIGKIRDQLLYFGENNYTELARCLVTLHATAQHLESNGKDIAGSLPADKIFYRGSISEAAYGNQYEELSYHYLNLSDDGSVSIQGYNRLESVGKVSLNEAIQIPPTTFEPFETIGLIFYSSPVNNIFDQSAQGKLILIPAVVYYCYDLKSWNQVKLKTLLDVIQLAAFGWGLKELQTLQRGWRVWTIWAELAVNVPDYLLNIPAIREQIRGIPGGTAFLFYWDRCALIANGLLMSPFAALYAKNLVKTSAYLGVRGALVLGDKWRESSALLHRLQQNYQLAALRGVAFSGVWFEIKKILNSDALQRLDALNFAEAERAALYNEIKQNATLAKKFNDTPAELNNWLDAYRRGKVKGGIMYSILQKPKNGTQKVMHLHLLSHLVCR